MLSVEKACPRGTVGPLRGAQDGDLALGVGLYREQGNVPAAGAFRPEMPQKGMHFPHIGS